ncbi:hypothetical protein N7512_007555 [Penicillium capsulatum]|nr:hypothetical protein N7512_007555 [Penicillium capsulatum]
MPQLLRMTLLMKRKEGMSAEEFRRYWAEVHAAKFLSVSLVKDHLVKYQRFYSLLDLVSSASSSNFHTPSVSRTDEFDGGAEFWAESMEDLEAVFASQEYYEKVYLDEDNFLDREKSRTLIGWEDVSLKNNE